MNKNKAFSLMEVIVSVFILILVLIPSIKLNIQQIKTYSKIRNADSELHFFTSLNNYLKAENILNSHLEFSSYTDFITTFNNFGNSFQNLKNKNFKLIISLGGLLYLGEINIFLQIYIFYLLVFLLATLYIIIYIVMSYCRNKPVKIRGVELAFAPYICLAFIIIYNFNLIERIIERIL